MLSIKKIVAKEVSILSGKKSYFSFKILFMVWKKKLIFRIYNIRKLQSVFLNRPWDLLKASENTW